MGCFEIISTETYFFLKIAAACFGFLGTLAIMLVYLKFAQIRTFSNKLIFNLALSQNIISITYFIPNIIIRNETVCLVSGLVFNSLLLSTIFWTFSIVLTLNILIGKPFNTSLKFYKYWVVTAWIIIPALNLLPLITDSYSSANDGDYYTCTYKSNDFVSELWRMALFYVPAWLFIILSSVIYCKVYKKLSELRLEGESKEFINRLFFYPLFLLGILVPLSILRVYQIFENNCVSELMFKIVNIMFGVQGFLYFIVFFRTPSVISCIRPRKDLNAMLSQRNFLSDFDSSMASDFEQK